MWKGSKASSGYDLIFVEVDGNVSVSVEVSLGHKLDHDLRSGLAFMTISILRGAENADFQVQQRFC